ncbi:tetraacyldisaccharide 4'-kinase [Bacteroides sp. 214]|uniref:tetraacyldisaccharide 4'-kinase n=1 Tax=Bacteroides sp. 214 TaxID=2302935 RepID=UPI0013D34F53|nr:tetraacyldisaccharide 4'-kinase [Bacteroides sp. 214]NDW12362.1 tetraacyldisaccharide 4'-kinase [Bacteroides sp. 214]
MDEKFVKINKWLYPLSFLYGIGVGLRNKLFDWRILRSKSFDVPVICIGNIAVGGTGKTPHTEYLIKLLQHDFRIAVLSRGYKRKSKGYILANEQSTAQTIGDEPFQIKNKFPEVTLAVAESRVEGIEQLLKTKEDRPDVILLDDAFQHRYVHAGVYILLTDYHRLFCYDTLLPAGRLREPAKAKDRAQVVVVTKCPPDLKPIEYNIIAKKLQLYPYQKLFFSTFVYGKLTPILSKEKEKRLLSSIKKEESVLLVTGIAAPESIIKEIGKYTGQIETLTFGDHHNFTSKDIKTIEERFAALKGEKLIITTEKDASRLVNATFSNQNIKQYIYALPIEVQILQGQQHLFNKYIYGYARKNKRDRTIS